MKSKTKYIKFEQDAIIILVDSDDLNIPVKDLKICELCTLTWKRPVYHYSPSAPAKPDLMLEVNLQGKTLTASETGGRLNKEV
jgi:hypothetical protein